MQFDHFTEIFLLLQARILAEVPEIRYIDQDLGQLEEGYPKTTASMPALLIDFDRWTFATMGGNVQEGEGSVVCRLAFPSYSDTNNLTPDVWKRKGLAMYALENKLHRALQGWTPGQDAPQRGEMEDYVALLLLNSCSGLHRSGAETEKRDDGWRVRFMTYNLRIEDWNTKDAQYGPLTDFNDDFNADFGAEPPALVVQY